MTIMGFGRYQVQHRRILFLGQDITHLPTYERAQLGVGIAFSGHPPSAASRPKTFCESAPAENCQSRPWPSNMGLNISWIGKLTMDFPAARNKKIRIIAISSSRP